MFVKLSEYIRCFALDKDNSWRMQNKNEYVLHGIIMFGSSTYDKLFLKWLKNYEADIFERYSIGNLIFLRTMITIIYMFNYFTKYPYTLR